MNHEADSASERRSPTRRARVAPIVWLGVVAAAGILFFLDPTQHGFFPPCLFHRLTGWNCPGCGATRAAHALLHGRMAAALRDNALVVGALPWLAWFAARQVWRRRQRQETVAVFRPVWLWIFLAVMAGFAVLRNLPSGTWLSPQ